MATTRRGNGEAGAAAWPPSAANVVLVKTADRRGVAVSAVSGEMDCGRGVGGTGELGGVPLSAFGSYADNLECATDAKYWKLDRKFASRMLGSVFEGPAMLL